MKDNNQLLLGFIPKSVSKSQTEGTGMAVTLLLLLIRNYTGNEIFYKFSIPTLLVTMTVPQLFYPFAVVWFALANLLNKVMPKVMLTCVYVLVLLPIGLWRRLLGHDPLLLKQWKKSKTSLMKQRNHVYVATDLEKPY